MEFAGTSLAIVATIDLCIKSYRTYKNAESVVAESVLSIEDAWLKTELQLETMQRLWPSLDTRIQLHFTKLLQHLQNKLQMAITKLQGVLHSATSHAMSETNLEVGGDVRIRKWKLLLLKSDIQDAIADLETWQKRLDPSWYLLTLLTNRDIDEHLQASPKAEPTDRLKGLRNTLQNIKNARKEPIFVDSESLIPNRRKIEHSSVWISLYRETREAVIINPTDFTADVNRAITVTHVRDLARLLSQVDTSVFGLLRCSGVVRLPDDTQFDWIFTIPSGVRTNPKSLRGHLLAGTENPLEERFRLANHLARSLMFIHTMGFVHKNIRPETIIIFSTSESVLGRAFLIGFERFRMENGGTTRLQSSSTWETNLYRHPQRRGLFVEAAYIMQHDIYSLGVCMLEIGLWNSFICYEGDLCVPVSELHTANIPETERGAVQVGMEVKEPLIAMAKDRLPQKMGSQYADITIACLTCLDPEETNILGAKSELVDEDGIIVGIAYIEKILTKLEDISI